MARAVKQIDIVLPPFRNQSALCVEISVMEDMVDARVIDDGLSGWAIAVLAVKSRRTSAWNRDANSRVVSVTLCSFSCLLK
uniref:Uncharacterized protein n=1 Tax=Strigamia maritima TaxID=126957 RepID=T1IPT3_STRMM